MNQRKVKINDIVPKKHSDSFLQYDERRAAISAEYGQKEPEPTKEFRPEGKKIREHFLKKFGPGVKNGVKKGVGFTFSAVKKIKFTKKQKPISKNLSAHYEITKDETEESRPKKSSRRQKTQKITLYFVELAIVGLLASIAINSYAHLTIYIFPRTIIIPANDLVVNAGNENGSDMPIKIMQIEAEKEKEVAVTEVKKTDTKASGKIVIFNDYSSESQMLVKTTRFETPDGKIYRIDKNITVPGTTVKNGKKTPGSVEATVYADKIGPEYNIGLTDFTIPGFKGSPKYEKFYGRSKTPMTGGGSVNSPSLSEKDLQDAGEDLKKILSEELTAKVELKNPEGYIYFKEAHKIDFETAGQPSQDPAGQGKAVLKIKATLSTMLISKSDLEKFIISKREEQKNMNKVAIEIPGELIFTDIKTNYESQTVSFVVRGNIKFKYLIDQEELKKSIIASSDKKLETILAKYPAIDGAHFDLSPDWWPVFPQKESKIMIEIKER